MRAQAAELEDQRQRLKQRQGAAAQAAGGQQGRGNGQQVRFI